MILMLVTAHSRWWVPTDFAHTPKATRGQHRRLERDYALKHSIPTHLVSSPVQHQPSMHVYSSSPTRSTSKYVLPPSVTRSVAALIISTETQKVKDESSSDRGPQTTIRVVTVSTHSHCINWMFSIDPDSEEQHFLDASASSD